MSTIMIRPGYLVHLKATISGGVSYNAVELEHETEGNEDRRKIMTEVVTSDVVEHKKALEIRSQARSMIERQCIRTNFGPICPPDPESKARLDEAIRQARKLVRDANTGFVFTRVNIYALAGQMASTDAEAIRSIGSEVASLINEMNEAVDKLDPDAMRDAANRANRIVKLLGDDQKAMVDEAIKQVRKAARVVTSRIAKKGEEAAIVARDIQRGAIERARIAFLDMDEDAAAPAPGEELPAVQTRAIDMDDDEAEAAPESDSEEPAEGETIAASAQG